MTAVETSVNFSYKNPNYHQTNIEEELNLVDLHIEKNDTILGGNGGVSSDYPAANENNHFITTAKHYNNHQINTTDSKEKRIYISRANDVQISNTDKNSLNRVVANNHNRVRHQSSNPALDDSNLSSYSNNNHHVVNNDYGLKSRYTYDDSGSSSRRDFQVNSSRREQLTQSSPDLLAEDYDEDYGSFSISGDSGGGGGGGQRSLLKRWQSTDLHLHNNGGVEQQQQQQSKNNWRQNKTSLNGDETIDRNYYTINSNSTMQNGFHQNYYQSVDQQQQHHHHHQQQHWQRDIDYSPQDFRRNLATIDHAARRGTSPLSGGSAAGGAGYPAGGLKVRREGDTTVVTEHRDPYSFYWQLDKIKRQEEPPPRREETGENVIEEYIADDITQVQSPDSHDSGIHVEYTRPSKPVKKLSKRFTPTPVRDESPKRKLPPGWERHEDPKGYSYYWHVRSGVVQREPPTEPLKLNRAYVDEEKALYVPKVMPLVPKMAPQWERVVPKTVRSMAVDRVTQVEPQRIMVDRAVPAPPAPVVQAHPPQTMVVQQPPPQPVIVERAFKQTTTKRRIENDTTDSRDNSSDYDGLKLPVRFAVRSMGWTEIPEEDLTQERSSRAVNKAIVDLSTGRNDFVDNVAKWGDGKELIMELDDRDLRLIDPDNGALLHVQPIYQIRVWGVGRDNGRDFAYVARDRTTRRFMCHVFRCDTPARTIANTLRDICKRLMQERRPSSLQTTHSIEAPDSFPTPMEEPKKIVRCHFLGVTQVPKATGIDILNEAVDRLVSQVRTERLILCDVSISPSTITITEVGGNLIAECRVRYLSFLGIGRDIKHCAFIMQTSSDNFMCYVFHVEPSAGAMAKTIEAACKLRYQKVLDAHTDRRSMRAYRGWGDTIRDVFGTFTGTGGRSARSVTRYPR